MRLFSVFIFLFAGSRFQSSKEDFNPSFLGTAEVVVAGRADTLSFSPAPSTVPMSSHNPASPSISDTGFLPDVSYQFPAAGTLSGDKITTVSTFQNISLYWKPFDGGSKREALVRYRIKGTVKWAQAQSLWFDDRTADSIGNNNARSKEYRGSIVNLQFRNGL